MKPAYDIIMGESSKFPKSWTFEIQILKELSLRGLNIKIVFHHFVLISLLEQ